MAYVVARRDGRFEIRENLATPRGPRARTLVTFRVLTDGALRTAQARATRPFDRERIEARATALGVPRDPRETLRLAQRLLVSLETGQRLPDVVASALAETLTGQLSADPLPDSIPPLAEWAGASERDRGDALRDLLRMSDRIPHRARGSRRRFPRIASARS